MNVVSILLLLAAAGQVGWTPERSVAPAVSSAEFDRYAQPPASAPQVTAPRSVSGRNVAPPPWSESATTSTPDWSSQPSSFSLQPPLMAQAPSVARTQTANGWTSIGSNVPAPQILVPALRVANNSASSQPVASGTGGISPPPLVAPTLQGGLGDTQRQAIQPSAVDSWTTGWGNSGNNTPSVTISRNADQASSATGNGLVPVQPIERPREQSVLTLQAPQQTGRAQPPSSWSDLWGDNDPWEQEQPLDQAASPTATIQQTQPSAVGSPPPSTVQTAPPRIDLPSMSNADPSMSSAGQAPIFVQQAAGPAPTQHAASTSTAPQMAAPPASVEQPPWLPLLVVSLSLAGSLGANLFLGWSYVDARQKYQMLVRKTADKFRRTAAA